ncbi:MAG: phosphate starvation-inducible protein PhoH, partial [Actinoplanes sp.]|nr:phosphate starvation-inducible protein PhoH [Actinoplanes sp.]
MTGTDHSSAAARVQTRISVANPKIMVNLLGAKDEILRLIERILASDVHVRGNEITITGAPADNATAERLFAELIELIEKGET